MAAELAPPIEYVLPSCATDAVLVHLPRLRWQLVVFGAVSPFDVSRASV